MTARVPGVRSAQSKWSAIMRRIVPQVAASWLLIIVPCVWLYAPVVAKLVHDWIHDENYSHGFLIVPLAMFFAWERRHRLASTPNAPSWAGLLVVIAALALVIVGTLGA